MSRIIDSQPFSDMVKVITDSFENESMKILVAGQIEAILLNYNAASVKALTDLYYAIPKQYEDADWYSDELSEAMEQASKIV